MRRPSTGADLRPLSPETADDFAALCRQMGPNRGCWCMYWREDPGAPRTMTRRQGAESLIADTDRPATGFLAYEAGEPVGWVACAPRAEYPRLNRGRDTAPLDDAQGADLAGTWAVPCFFVVPNARGRGVAAALLARAVAHAAQHGANAVEGVPGDPATRSRTASASYTGTLAMFLRAGFGEVARRTPKGRVLVRRRLREPGRPS